MATINGLSPNKALTINEKLNRGVALSTSEFKSVMSGFKAQITDALPVHLKNNAEKYMRQAIMQFNQNPKLQECTPISILTALMTASGLGLDLTPQLGQCYIIPYENRKKIGNKWVSVPEAQFQLGYRGVIALAYRSEQVLRIEAHIVHEKDYFKFSRGLNPVLEHEDSTEEDRGAITYVYALATFKNGGYAFDVWPIAKVIAHAKKFSKSYFVKDYRTGEMVINQKSPWATNFEEMARKTLILAIWKYLPLSSELLMAGMTDESIHDNASKLANIENEKDIIAVPVDYSEPEPEPEPEPEEVKNDTADQAADEKTEQAEQELPFDKEEA